MIRRLRYFVFFKITEGLKRRRMEFFLKAVNIKGNETILDIGAGEGSLLSRFCSKKNLNWIGLGLMQSNSRVYKQFIIGDTRRLPFKDKSIDVVFSNSVLEHVGDLSQQQLMAKEIVRIGKKFFIQAPNKHFPIEPHFFIPFLQYLPLRWQGKITHLLFDSEEEIHLPTAKILKELFPSCKIKLEKFLGLTKSFYVWKA